MKIGVNSTPGFPFFGTKAIPLIFAKHCHRLGPMGQEGELGVTGDWSAAWGSPSSEKVTRMDEDLLLFDLLELQDLHGFKLLGFIPPSPGSRWQPSAEAVSELQRHFPVIDHTRLCSRTHEAGYFHDRSHFSEPGAQEFSALIGGELKRLLATPR